MRSQPPGVFDGANAMLPQRGAGRGDCGNRHVFLFMRFEDGAFEKRRFQVQNRVIPGDLDIAPNRVGEPQQIVRTAGSNAEAGFGMPPVLHIALGELTRCRQQNVRVGQLRRRV